MVFEIPIDVTTATADGEITFDVELDGRTYAIQLSWCDSAQLWFMSLFLQSNTTASPIAQGIALVTAMPLLLDVQVPERPPGELLCVGDHDATRTDLGGAVKLHYHDAAEIAAL